MMEIESLTRDLQARFGAGLSVETRRPHSVYQIQVPAFLADGDIAQVFVCPAPDGRVRITDLGATRMRLSYTRQLTGRLELTLEGIAQRHGFSLVSGEIQTTTASGELVAGIIGLIQVESAAEVAIDTAVRRAESSESFAQAVRESLQLAFKGQADIQYHLPDDVEGLYTADAVLRLGQKRAAGICIVTTDGTADRAVMTKLYFDARAKKNAPTRWFSIARNINALGERARSRLIKEAPVVVPVFDEEKQTFTDKLRLYAA